MIAKGFRPVAWVGAVGTAALCCYMLSLKVAAERAELASLERRIVATSQDIRALQTELGTRGRMQQLEQWNAEVLALSAPTAAQYLDSEVRLARFDQRAPAFDAPAQVRMAAAAPAPAPVQPQQAVAAQAPAAAPAEPAQPRVRQASLSVEPAAERPAPVRAAAVQAAAPAPPPAAAAPRPARGLLDEGTIREIGAAARAEREGAARD